MASRFAVIDGLDGEWLVEHVGGCTCGAPFPGAPGAHEPGCGDEPVGRVEDLIRERNELREKLAERDARIKELESEGWDDGAAGPSFINQPSTYASTDNRAWPPPWPPPPGARRGEEKKDGE